MSRILEFLRGTHNYKTRGTVLRISDSNSGAQTTLTKKELSRHFQDALSAAGKSPRVEICRRDKNGITPIAAYREIKLGDGTGIFLD